jgi:ribosomal peptide maturation radical SAM protein 1
MDALPLPRFDDYFAAVEHTSFRDDTWLAAESSRGCWWGLKSHCTFCGLNGGTMAFRSKSAPRFAAELETLSEKYGTTRIALTDNILDMTYLRTLLPELVAQARQYQLFYETKSNLRKDQVELLAAAGIASLQPGIESFSTPILKLMAKGTTRLQNVQLLKWCLELGVKVSWNLLYGFPGEDPGEYREMEELLPALFHLPPPMGASKVRLDRFGPYWKWPERYGICNLRHHWSYDFVFAGLPEEARDRLAYFFEHEYEDGSDPRAYARTVAELATDWRQAPRGSARLMLRTSAAGPTVLDTRPCRSQEVVPLTPAGLALLRVLDGYRSRGSVISGLHEQGVEISDAGCERLLADFVARRFVIEEKGSLLSLVVDPEQRHRVAERQVALRAGRFGFRWPDDFPDPAKQEVVRAAMLTLGGRP